MSAESSGFKVKMWMTLRRTHTTRLMLRSRVEFLAQRVTDERVTHTILSQF
jgi:hypothetical protein